VKGEGSTLRRRGGREQTVWKTASSFALEWTNGPTYFQDMLMVMYKASTMAPTGTRDTWTRICLRTGRDGPLAGKTLPKGRDDMLLMLVFRDDINDTRLPSLREVYRSPASWT